MYRLSLRLYGLIEIHKKKEFLTVFAINSPAYLLEGYITNQLKVLVGGTTAYINIFEQFIETIDPITFVMVVPSISLIDERFGFRYLFFFGFFLYLKTGLSLLITQNPPRNRITNTELHIFHSSSASCREFFEIFR